MKNKEVIFEEVKTPEGMLPIFLVDIIYSVRIYGKKQPPQQIARKIVAKGDFDMIKESDSVKKRVVFQYFLGKSDIKKKVNNFDLNKVKIHKVKLIKFLGNGIK